jgi:hypothetical protein
MSRFRLPGNGRLTVILAALGAVGLVAVGGLVMPVANDYLWPVSSSGGSAISTVSPPLVRVRATPWSGHAQRLVLITVGVVVCTPATGQA